MSKFFPKYKSLSILIGAVSLSTILIFYSVDYTTPIEKGLMGGLLRISELQLSLLRGISDLWEWIISIQTLSHENLKLKRMVKELLREKALYKIAMSENERLRSLLNYKETLPYRTIVAEVIGYAPTNWTHSLLLNRGTDDGVGKDDIVIGYFGLKEGLVGRVIEVEKDWSRVLLILDVNSKVGVKIPRTHLKGVLEGLNSRICRLKYIPTDADVMVGDAIFTSGAGGIFPEGIPIGKVARVEKEGGRIFSDVYVLPSIEFSRLREVLILIKEG